MLLRPIYVNCSPFEGCFYYSFKISHCFFRKNYIWSYRDEGCFHEAVTNKILDDLVQATEPRFMRLEAIFNVRGGIYTTVVAEHKCPNWTPKDAVRL